MPALRLRAVSKRYRLKDTARRTDSFGRRLAARFAQRQHDFWALRGLTLQVEHGETVGVIGHNGAGKSTLLKLLSRITAPSEGEIVIHGRLSALIELGSGFHPELTGRENLFLSGAILGMRRREIVGKLEKIVEFSGIDEFIDVPVKWYSSGMYVRLGFAMAAHLEPDILLVDEVLSVGDASFQGKCFARIAELKAAGTTIVLISHDLSSVERLSDRVLLLDHGRLTAEGRPADVISRYQRGVDDPAGTLDTDARGDVEITTPQILDAAGSQVSTARTGDPLRVRVGYTARRRLEALRFEVSFYSLEDGVLQAQCATPPDGPGSVVEGDGQIQFEIPVLGLQPGVYTLFAAVHERGKAAPSHWNYGRSTLYVTCGRHVGGRFYMAHSVTGGLP